MLGATLGAVAHAESCLVVADGLVASAPLYQQALVLAARKRGGDPDWTHAADERACGGLRPLVSIGPSSATISGRTGASLTVDLRPVPVEHRATLLAEVTMGHLAHGRDPEPTPPLLDLSVALAPLPQPGSAPPPMESGPSLWFRAAGEVTTSPETSGA